MNEIFKAAIAQVVPQLVEGFLNKRTTQTMGDGSAVSGSPLFKFGDRTVEFTVTVR
jgi:hypothetical protein